MSKNYFNLLRAQVVAGSAKGVEEFLPRVLEYQNVKPVLSMLLVDSVTLGFQDVFNLLLPHADPKHNNSMALRVAANIGKAEFVNLLLPISDYDAARKDLMEAGMGAAILCLDSVVQKDRLLAVYGDESVKSGLRRGGL